MTATDADAGDVDAGDARDVDAGDVDGGTGGDDVARAGRGDVLGAWLPDRLLSGYEALTLPGWRPDAVGPAARAVAAGGASPLLTVVRPPGPPAAPRGVVVHLHGYNDYFFQTHLADACHAAGWAFLGLDARRAGRSLRPGDVPHYQGDLREQASDLTRAVGVARSVWPGTPVVVHGHSMGGLVTALWAHAHRSGGGPDAVVLNNPFLSVERSWVTPLQDGVLRPLARTTPLRVVASAPSRYAARLAERWDVDTALKRPEGVPVRAGWLAAARSGQLRVARGLAIGVPVLVARSARSGSDVDDGPDLDTADTVLDVATIAALAPRLGTDVRELVVEDAVHDLTLSLEPARTTYLHALADFLATLA